jgi:hypothetical protein
MMSKKPAMIAVAAGLLVSAFLVVVLGVLGWSVYKLAEVRRDKASIDDLNRVIDHLNSLSHGVHRSHIRAEKRIDKNEGALKSAGEVDTTIQSRLDVLAKQLAEAAATANAAKATGTTLGTTVTDLGASLRKDLGDASTAIGGVSSRLQSTDKTLAATNSTLAATNETLVPIKALADSIPSAYARWDAPGTRNLSASAVSFDSGAAKKMRADRFGLNGKGGAEVGYIKANEDGSAMQFLRGSSLVSELSGSGIRWGTSELKVVPSGAGGAGAAKTLQYCQDKVCFPVRLDRGPLDAPPKPPATFPPNSVPVPAASANLVKSKASMRTGEFNTGSGEAATPFSGLQNLPAFLVGVPMTKGINNKAYSVSFDGGGIHAYGFRRNGWNNFEPGVSTVFGGSTKYDASGDSIIDTVVHKFFAGASFTIDTRSYIWFFTRTPVNEGIAALNSIPIPRGGMSLATSTATMAAGVFDTGGGFSATPYSALKNLPAFLVGVPMTKGINNRTYSVAFDGGGVHAYGFRSSGWSNEEPGVEPVLSGDARYDGDGGDLIDTVVYKYFQDPAFTVNTMSYIWFFTRTPKAEGAALLNSTPAPVLGAKLLPPSTPLPLSVATESTPPPAPPATPPPPPPSTPPPPPPSTPLVREYFKIYHNRATRDITSNGDGTFSYDTDFSEDDQAVEFKLPPGHQFQAQMSLTPSAPNSKGELSVKQINPDSVLARREVTQQQSISYGFTGTGDREYGVFSGGASGSKRIRITLRPA